MIPLIDIRRGRPLAPGVVIAQLQDGPRPLKQKLDVTDLDWDQPSWDFSRPSAGMRIDQPPLLAEPPFAVELTLQPGPQALTTVPFMPSGATLYAVRDNAGRRLELALRPGTSQHYYSMVATVGPEVVAEARDAVPRQLPPPEGDYHRWATVALAVDTNRRLHLFVDAQHRAQSRTLPALPDLRATHRVGADFRPLVGGIGRPSGYRGDLASVRIWDAVPPKYSGLIPQVHEVLSFAAPRVAFANPLATARNLAWGASAPIDPLALSHSWFGGVPGVEPGQAFRPWIFGPSSSLALEAGPGARNMRRFTVEALIHPTGLTGDRSNLVELGATPISLSLRPGSQADRVSLRISVRGRPSGDAADDWIGVTADDVVPLHHWSTVAATFDGRQLTLFVDGDVVARSEYPDLVLTEASGVHPLLVSVGCWGADRRAPSHQFVGRLAAVRVSQGVLDRYDRLAPLQALGLKVPTHLHALRCFEPEVIASADLRSDPFGDAQLEAGVHLHWSLPDALCHAEHDPALGEHRPRFPSVPDTWLVTRLYTVGGPGDPRPPRRTARHWVLESRSRKATPLADWRPSPTPPGRPRWTCVGRQDAHGDLLDFPHPAGAGDVLTMGGFSGYYPLARGRFGFHDDLSDLAGPAPLVQPKLSYLVVGWYSDLGEDPLASPPTADWLARSGWRWALPAAQLGVEERSSFEENQEVINALLSAVAEAEAAVAEAAPPAEGSSPLAALIKEERQKLLEDIVRPGWSAQAGHQIPSVVGERIEQLSAHIQSDLSSRLPDRVAGLIATRTLGDESRGYIPNRTYIHGMVAGVPLAQPLTPDEKPAPAQIQVQLGQTGPHALARWMTQARQDDAVDPTDLEALAAGHVADLLTPERRAALPGRLHAQGFMDQSQAPVEVLAFGAGQAAGERGVLDFGAEEMLDRSFFGPIPGHAVDVPLRPLVFGPRARLSIAASPAGRRMPRFTVEALVHPTGVSAPYSSVIELGATPITLSLHPGVGRRLSLRASVGVHSVPGASPGWATVTAHNAVPLNAWSTVAAMFDGHRLHLVVDGRWVASEAIPESQLHPVNPTGADLGVSVGCRGARGPRPDCQFLGRLAGVRIIAGIPSRYLSLDLPDRMELAAGAVPPRFYRPLDPEVLVVGARRGMRHGHDSDYTDDGRLSCRVTGQSVIARILDDRTIGLAERFQLSTPLDTVPHTVRELVVEAPLLDPDLPVPALQERTERWLIGSYVRRWGELPNGKARLIDWQSAASTFIGERPAPPAARLWAQPWQAVFADYGATLTLSAPRQISLQTVEHTYQVGKGDETPIAGRTLLDDGLVKTLMDQVRQLTQHLTGGAGSAANTESDEQALLDEQTSLEVLSGLESAFVDLDAVTFSLAPLMDRLRADGRAHSAGTIRLDALRIIDTFGRFVDWPSLAGRAEQLPLRLPRWARINARFLNLDAPAFEARAHDPSLAAVLVPDHIEGTLECFDRSGKNLGQVEPVSGQSPGQSPRIRFSAGPGAQAARGGRALGHLSEHPELSAVLQPLITAGTLDAFLNLLRLADTTQLSPSADGSHRARYLGQPLGLYRLRLQLEVEADVPAPPPVPIRIGSAMLPADGVVAVIPAFNRDTWYTPFLATFAPFNSAGGSLMISAGQTVEVLVLMALGSALHVTTGILPEKKLTPNPREAEAAAAHIHPVLSVGPVLLAPDPKVPVADIKGTEWRFHYLDSDGAPDAARWVEQGVTPNDGYPELPRAALRFASGWLRLVPSQKP